MNVSYPRIDDGMPASEKVEILARQVASFIQNGDSRPVAMRKVVFYRYSSRFSALWHEVSFHRLVKEAKPGEIVSMVKASPSPQSRQQQLSLPLAI